MKKTKMEKGITLIALIISIVILLILAVVTIGAVNESKIIAHSQNASSEYTIAQEKENLQLALGEWAMQKYSAEENTETFENFMDRALSDKDVTISSIDGETLTLTFNKTGNSYTVKSDGTIIESKLSDTDGNSKDDETLVSLYKSGKLNIGDYVLYSPTGQSSYTPDGEIAGSITGWTESLQTISQQTLNWRIMGYDETSNKILLISAEPTTNGLWFYGLIGYNNYISVLNETCDKLYSSTGIGKARSITTEDIDKYLDGNTFDKTVENPSSADYGYTRGDVITIYSENETTGKLTMLEEAISVEMTGTNYSYTFNKVINDTTKLELLQGIGTKDKYYYNIASTCVQVSTDSWEGNYCGSPSWCHFYVSDGELDYQGIVDGRPAYATDDSGVYGLGLRVVIELESNVTTKEVEVRDKVPESNWYDWLGLYIGS